MNNLNSKIINYELDYSEVIDKSKTISSDILHQLLYILMYLENEGLDVEMKLKIKVPANTEANIVLPIIYEEDHFGYCVNWGDKKRLSHNIPSHTYSKSDTEEIYTIKIFGMNIIGFGNNNLDNTNDFRKYLISVLSFGNLGHKFTSLSHAFNRCLNNFTVPENIPSSVTDVSYMFKDCCVFNQPLNSWSVNNIINMCGMFYWCSSFNQPLNLWWTRNVTDMSYMFCACASFNQPLNSWSVHNVTNMRGMFSVCSNFNQPLDLWFVNNVTNMSAMFNWCINFNQSLNSWVVNNVTNMSFMFSWCSKFNQPLNLWYTANVTNMCNMFYLCSKFNQPLNTWLVHNVTNMNDIFYGCDNFKQQLDSWQIDNIISTTSVFNNNNQLNWCV